MLGGDCLLRRDNLRSNKANTWNDILERKQKVVFNQRLLLASFLDFVILFTYYFAFCFLVFFCFSLYLPLPFPLLLSFFLVLSFSLIFPFLCLSLSIFHSHSIFGFQFFLFYSHILSFFLLSESAFSTGFLFRFFYVTTWNKIGEIAVKRLYSKTERVLHSTCLENQHSTLQFITLAWTSTTGAVWKWAIKYLYTTASLVA